LEYIFKHHLTQQAAYNGLLRRERQRFHHRVAAAWERLFPERMEEQLGFVAYHWEHSGESERAIEYLHRAGEQAAAQFANAEAIGYFSRALDLTPDEDLSRQYDLLLAREGVYDVQGAREIQRQELAVLERLAEALDDDRRRAEVALRQTRCAHHLPDYPAAIIAAQRAVRLAHTAGDVRIEAEAYLRWGRALGMHGDVNAGHTRVDQALKLARAAHLRQVEATILWFMGDERIGRGDIPDARACLEQSLRISLEIGDRRQENVARLYLAFAALGQGDCDEATILHDQAEAALHEIGYRWWEALVPLLPGRVYHHLGEYDRARAYYEEFQRRSHEVGNRRVVAMALCHLGMLSHHVGDDEAARDRARQALQTARDQGCLVFEPASALCLGHALVGLGSLDEAKNAYRHALDVLCRLEWAHQAMEPLAGLARVCLAQGDLAQAQAHVEETLGYLEYRTRLNAWFLGEPLRVYLTCYRVLQANGDPRAEDILEEGYKFLQERVAKITNEEDRRSYLENVAANREIVREYVHRQGDMTANSQD